MQSAALSAGQLVELLAATSAAEKADLSVEHWVDQTVGKKALQRADLKATMLDSWKGYLLADQTVG